MNNIERVIQTMAKNLENKIVNLRNDFDNHAL
jgi:hypothetical protein